MRLTSTPVVTELKNTLSVKELVPDAFLVEVGVVETVGEGKEVVGEITAGGLVENLLLIRSRFSLYSGRWKLLTFIPRTFS